MAQNGILRLIFRILVDPKNYVLVENLPSIKHCKGQLQVSSAHSVFWLPRHIYRLIAYQRKTWFFFPTKRKLSPTAKIKLSQIVYVTRKQSWNKLKTVIIPNTSNWQLKIDGRRCQEIWKKKFLTFRFVVWKHPPIIFSSFPIWSKFIEGTITGRCKMLLN